MLPCPWGIRCCQATELSCTHPRPDSVLVASRFQATDGLGIWDGGHQMCEALRRSSPRLLVVAVEERNGSRREVGVEGEVGELTKGRCVRRAAANAGILSCKTQVPPSVSFSALRGRRTGRTERTGHIEKCLDIGCERRSESGPLAAHISLSCPLHTEHQSRPNANKRTSQRVAAC